MKHKKPLIFVSHSHRDSPFVHVLRDWINRELLGAVEFFVSTDDESLPMGSRWFEKISTALESASVALVVISPESLRNTWIFFEAGAGTVRRIPVIPVCIGGIGIEELPAPLDQLQALDLMEESQQILLLNAVAKAAGLNSPASPVLLALRKRSALPRWDFEFGTSGILGIKRHADAYSDLFARLRNRSDPPKNLVLSGASLTEIIHIGTSELANFASAESTESVRLILKKADAGWSKITSDGMLFRSPYSWIDSYKMCEQSRRDAEVLIALTGGPRSRVAVRECTWPPTYSFALLDYESFRWGFVEPILYGVGLAERLCIMLVDGPGERREILAMLDRAFEDLWLNSEEVVGE